ncbi:cysteine-rich with EGF-like domain protein 2 [Anticarsia gemmatalis]|uniref:cysteine-rich with EGF-like domain protein 2 n=1 Tax=Anticarsia gemmatalis TaxID=129554 RepID=UPI003F76FC2B
MGELLNKSLLLLFLYFQITIIGSKKIASRNINESSGKLSECRRCKILTDSFNHWLDKTSRGKYEGGDAAWEEEKLKSYARSEIRLVEIQEGLCSELKIHQDPCYTLAEEAEQVLEKWWFYENPNAADLYTWLCIENLQHCCHKGHFGAACSACPKDKHNKVCGGHGKCDGDGTRLGNGTCLCRKGYMGIMCDECSENYYLSEAGTCDACHASCNGCKGEGADSCEACKTGWELHSGVCVDVNECSSSVCKLNEYCTNTEGSHRCTKCDLSCKTCMGDGPSNCTSCESTNVLWFGECIDDELQQNYITNSIRRLALYIGLLVITLFIFRSSTSVVTIVVVILAVYIYFTEKNLKMTTFNVLQHLLFSAK